MYMNDKELIESKFNALIDKARIMYPNIDEQVASYTNTIDGLTIFQNYLELTMLTPDAISTNYIKKI